VLPHITYRDLAGTILWLSDAFGFVEHYRYGNPLSGAQIRAGNAFIMLKQARHGYATPKELGFGTQSLTIFIQDIESHHGRAKSARVTILEDLHETVYGELQYAAEDLDCHHWLFSRHARDLSPDQWGATVSPAAVTAAPISPDLAASISPMLSVRTGVRAIEFYTAAFGAHVLFQVDSERGGVVAELAVAGSRFWLADESPANPNFSPESLDGGSVRMIMIADDPDAALQRAMEAGATVVWPVENQPHGWRVGRIVDPFGHHWEIGKPLPLRPTREAR
jgi:PhnB protein